MLSFRKISGLVLLVGVLVNIGGLACSMDEGERTIRTRRVATAEGLVDQGAGAGPSARTRQQDAGGAAAAAPVVVERGRRLGVLQQFILGRNQAFRDGDGLEEFEMSKLEEASVIHEPLELHPSAGGGSSSGARVLDITAAQVVQSYEMRKPRSSAVIRSSETDFTHVRFTLTREESVVQQTIFRNLELGLGNYVEEHKRNWDWKYTLGKLASERLLPAVVAGSASLGKGLFSRSFLSDKKEMSYGEVLGAFIAISYIWGAVCDLYQASSYHLGFTPSIYRLEAGNFDQELMIISVLAALRYRTPVDQSSAKLNKRLRAMAFDLLGIIRVQPMRRSVAGHCWLTVTSVGSTLRWCCKKDSYERVDEDEGKAETSTAAGVSLDTGVTREVVSSSLDFRTDGRGVHYLTQLRNTYRNLPSFNLYFYENYDMILSSVERIFLQ
jgi:hypothetical protein